MKNLVTFVAAISLIMGSYSVFPADHFDAETIDQKGAETLTYKKVEVNAKESSSTDHRFIQEEEKKLLARLVQAEAEGEPFEGKVAVADVVLNRVEHEQFPDTVKDVIYQKNAFEPVQNGSINEPASNEAVQAVETALVDKEQNEELLYFYNPETATSQWIFSREVVKKIGNHAFAI
ncbi:N-acetylmuramoyl-L-alanine amidase [Cytobacillus firmus]|uniref:N-acetylmuramoyl-L-alanine amidase n=2 Tax=Cytobacillus TaxID=2675230 RepID=A0A366K121_CYTFI|nr:MULTISPECIES: cell wall hydrolase [Cytobacillus]RBP95425.1 N-acetylmuramoyl-L-alanine amidase [Cytobacillus firmus]TDX44266.1 N-acetylmuramoyl-L-alanine amidase [Cytobacillus oceanisediminis]